MATIKERLDAIYGTREALDKVRAEKARKQAEREEKKRRRQLRNDAWGGGDRIDEDDRPDMDDFKPTDEPETPSNPVLDLLEQFRAEQEEKRKERRLRDDAWGGSDWIDEDGNPDGDAPEPTDTTTPIKKPAYLTPEPGEVPTVVDLTVDPDEDTPNDTPDASSNPNEPTAQTEEADEPDASSASEPPASPAPAEPNNLETPDSDAPTESESDQTSDNDTEPESADDVPAPEPEDTPEPESKPDEPEPEPKPADKATDGPKPDKPDESDDDDDPFSAKRSSAFTPPEDPLLDGEEMPFTAKNAKKDTNVTSSNTAEDEDVPDVYDQLKILFSISEKDEQGETRVKLTRFANIVTMHKGADIDYMKSIPHDLYLIDARTNKPIPATDAGFSENFRANFLVWFWRNVNARINNARMQGKKPYAEFIRDKKKPKAQPIQTDPQTSKPQSENTRKAEQPQQPQPPEPKQADLPELPAKSAPLATPSATPSGQPTPPQTAFRRSAAPYRSARPRR